MIYGLKKPYSDGTTNIKMQPLELMEKLAALVPRPRVHLTRFLGVLAADSKHRRLLVPAAVDPTGRARPTQRPANRMLMSFWVQVT